MTAVDIDRGLTDEELAGLTSSSGSSRADRVRLFAQPVVVAVVVIGTLIWAFTRNNDSIEQESINGPFLLQAVWDQLLIAIVVSALVVVIAVPLGVMVTRPWAKALAPFFLAIANIGQAAPAIGVLVLWFLATGTEGLWAAAIPLAFYSLLPVLRNTMVGLQGVDPALVDAGRGIGMSAGTVLRRIELPLAVPLILAGLRTSLVLAVGTATLAFFVNAGGLGLLIDTGYKLNRVPVLVVGSVLAVALALLIDWLGAVAEQYLGPKGLR
jgi:osmoprotectant transport system permease protein